MATLKEKSTINLSSALALTNKEENCLSSVHCDYYSCYQLMLYYLDTEYGYNDSKRKKEYDDYLLHFAGKSALGSHEYWIKKFGDILRSDNHIINSNIIDRNVKILKENRVEADYKDTDFTKRDTDRLYDMALNTIRIINKNFNV